eukprot:1149061-Pelagomonas_calceolata.AAC.2
MENNCARSSNHGPWWEPEPRLTPTPQASHIANMHQSHHSKFAEIVRGICSAFALAPALAHQPTKHSYSAEVAEKQNKSESEDGRLPPLCPSHAFPSRGCPSHKGTYYRARVAHLWNRVLQPQLASLAC